MITVVGSLNMDLVVNTERIPRPGETVMGRDFKQVPGGKGGNQAAAAAKLGAEVRMIGCIGRDDMGKCLRNSLEQDGVNTAELYEKEGIATGIAAIVVEASGNNSITVAPGANYALTAEDIKERSDAIQEADILLTQLETKIEAVEMALKLAKAAGKRTVLNPAPAIPLDKEILEYIDILTPNETELEVLTGFSTDTEENIAAAGRTLIGAGAKEIIVTLGERGCLHITENTVKSYSAYRVKSVDTTAAGDSFNGALVVYLDQGKTTEEAIEFAMKVGAMTVTREGAQTSLPRLADVRRFEDWIAGGDQ